MPLAGTDAALGIALANASGSVDAAGLAAWQRIATAFVTWAQTITVVATAGTPLVAAGTVISGTGGVVPAGTPAWGAAAPSVDATGIASWNAIASAAATGVAAGAIKTPLLVAYVGAGGGAVSGVGGLLIPTFGAAMAAAAGSTDAVGIARWTATGTALAAHLTANALVTPIMTNSGAGGPVAGTGTVS